MVDPFVDDGVYEDVAISEVYRGKDAIANYVKRGVSCVPDVKMTPASIIVEGQAGACEYRMTGTHTGDYPGLPATGNAINSRVMVFFEFEENKIKRVSDYWDLHSSGFVKK